MIKDKIKNLVPEMERLIIETGKDLTERGFTFRTNGDAKIEEFCKTGTKCQIEISDIEKKEGTKIGTFHTHPYTTMKTKKTNAIGGVFSCGDILLQASDDIDHGCVGTQDEIVCSTIKLRVPQVEKFALYDCVSLHHFIRKREEETEEYKGSEMQKNDIKKLDRLERDSDTDLKPYIDFEIIKRLKHA